MSFQHHWISSNFRFYMSVCLVVFFSVEPFIRCVHVFNKTNHDSFTPKTFRCASYWNHNNKSANKVLHVHCIELDVSYDKRYENVMVNYVRSLRFFSGEFNYIIRIFYEVLAILNLLAFLREPNCGILIDVNYVGFVACYFDWFVFKV